MLCCSGFGYTLGQNSLFLLKIILRFISNTTWLLSTKKKKKIEGKDLRLPINHFF